MKKNTKRNRKLKKTSKNRKLLALFILIVVLLLIIIGLFFKNQIEDYFKFVGKVILGSEDCSEWNECYFTYSLDDSDNIILDGEQKRTCLVNGIEKTETKKCFSKESITAKKTDNHIEVYDSKENLISKLEIVKDDEYKRLNIEIFK
mgnify:CR=1 FL=1